MDSSYRTHLVSFSYRSVRTFVLSATAFVIVLFASPALAQEKAEHTAQKKTARPLTQVLEMTDADARQFVIRALDLGLPEELADQLGVLAINRSYLVVPELLSRLEGAEHDSRTPARLAHTMADILAYAADEVAIDALTRLVVSGQDRYGYFVSRALDYANGRRNPYSLAYYALSKGGFEIDRAVTSWVRANAPVGNGYRTWAKAIVERSNGTPNDRLLLEDPILTKLAVGIPAGLRKELSEVTSQNDRKNNNK